MKPSQRLLLAFAAIVLCACVLSPIVKPLADYAVPKSRKLTAKLNYDASLRTYDFGQIFRRLLLLSALGVLVAGRRWLQIGSVAALGFRDRTGRRRDLIVGGVVGVTSMAAFVLLLLPLGAVLPKSADLSAGLVAKIGVYLIQAAVVGLLEETIFRGFVLQTLLKDMRFALAAGLSSALYALLHFFDAKVPVGADSSALLGFQALATCFTPLVSDPTIIPACLGLFLLGMVFAYAYRWTQSLYLPIALHASWVFSLKTSGKLLHLGLGGPSWLYGSREVVDGALGCLFLLAVMGLLWLLFGRSRQERA